MNSISGHLIDFAAILTEYYGTVSSTIPNRRNYASSIANTSAIQISANLIFSCDSLMTQSAIVLRSSSGCFYPLSFTIEGSELPVVVVGGDVITISLELTTSVFPVQQLAFFLDSLHPALLLINHVFTSNDGNTVYTDLVNVHSSENTYTLLVGNITLAISGILRANITFRVQPYVLPHANLYSLFKVYYYTQFSTEMSFIQSYGVFNQYLSGEVMHGNLSVILPSYAAGDHLENTYPPHVGDIFFINIPIIVPCISTDINLTITLPEFRSEVYVIFNITDVALTVPENLVYISELCNYGDPVNFNSSSCDIKNVQVVDRVPEVYSTHMDKLYNIHLGPILYNMTGIEDCILNSPTADCTCLYEEIIMSLRGHVINVSDMFCESQTLVDNIIGDYEYISESEAEGLFSNSTPAITFTSSSDGFVFEISAGAPAISVPINSFGGDAGDKYNLTFGIRHNEEYSSFTAYDLNYTFSIDPHLRPDENMTICYSNASNASICEIVPFLNNIINGFLPV